MGIYFVDVALRFHREPWRGRSTWEELAVPCFAHYRWLLTVIAVSYVPLIFGLKRFMKNRKAYDLRVPLAAWNLFLALFSGYGFIVSGWSVLRFFVMRNPSWYFMSCNLWCMDGEDKNPFLTGPVMWVAFMFNFSKFMEFLDTIFIVLRKRPLIFLHWYHHITTMLFCWYWNQHAHGFNCAGQFCGTMNYGVHFIMYFYYFLRAVGYKPRWDVVITTLQTVQMVIGSAFYVTTGFCPTWEPYSFWGGAVMYVSYFFLFFRILINRYVLKKRPRRSSRPSKGKVESKTD